MPERDNISARELKQLLKLERLRHTPPGRWFPRKVDPEQKLQEHNASDVCAAVEFMERQAPKGEEVRFPTSMVDELTAALPNLAASGETVRQMGDILDRMQASVFHRNEIDPGAEPGEYASQVFHAHHEASELRRLNQAKDAARHRAKRSR
jgi:hypothetical protein